MADTTTESTAEPPSEAAPGGTASPLLAASETRSEPHLSAGPRGQGATDPAAGLTRYVVGGAVRDRLLGQPVNDRDWVVVGATAAQMLEAGFQPVGRDFPVFLHPWTHEEHALARTERKSGRGYRGFVVHADPSVRLDDDLARRDLTINAMAEAPDGTLIDPCGGRADLAARCLRHVSPAFAEDPVRILRVARFSARWPEFTVADETARLMRQMVQAGEADALVPERIWQEVARGLMEVRPSRMLEVLVDCGALAAMMGVPVPPSARLQRTGRALDRVERSAAHRTARLVVWAMGLQAALQLPSRWKVPSDEREALMLAAREFDALPTMGRWATELRATPDDAPQADAAARALVAWLDHCDAWRRPERWQALVVAAAAWADAGTEDTRIPHPPGALASTTAHRWQTALTAVHQAAMAVDTRAAASAAIAAGARGPAIAAAVLAQRTEAVHTWLAGEGAATPGT